LLFRLTSRDPFDNVNLLDRELAMFYHYNAQLMYASTYRFYPDDGNYATQFFVEQDDVAEWFWVYMGYSAV